MFLLAWATRFQEGAEGSESSVYVRWGRLQSRFHYGHMELIWAEIIHKSHFPLSQMIELSGGTARTSFCLLCGVLIMWHCHTARGVEVAAVPGTAHPALPIRQCCFYMFYVTIHWQKFVPTNFCIIRTLSFTIKSNFSNFSKRELKLCSIGNPTVLTTN